MRTGEEMKGIMNEMTSIWIEIATETEEEIETEIERGTMTDDRIDTARLNAHTLY